MLFLILTVIVFNMVSIIIPKKISRIEILTTTLFAALLEFLADSIWDFKYDLYGYFSKGVDFAGFIYVFGIYPPINIVFLNLFPFKKNLVVKIIYILCWSLFAILFEVLFLLSKTFYYNGWKLGYSIILYPVIYLILISFYHCCHYLLNKDSNRN